MHPKRLMEKRLNYSQDGRAHARKITRTQPALGDRRAPLDRCAMGVAAPVRWALNR
jgi:hypothetical protein